MLSWAGNLAEKSHPYALVAALVVGDSHLGVEAQIAAGNGHRTDCRIDYHIDYYIDHLLADC